MGRTILAAVVGIVVAMLTITLVEWAGHQAWPPPPGLDPMVADDMARIIALQPFGALLVVVVAWVVGAFDGGLVAALVARDKRPRLAAVVPALVVTAGVVGMIMMMPSHPAWMAIAGLLLPVPAGLAGAQLAAAMRRRPGAVA